MQGTAGKRAVKRSRMQKLGNSIWQNRWLYVLILPALVYLIIFNYLSMYGVQIAFKDYKAVRGIAGSPWMAMGGFKHFVTFFNAYYFWRLIGNTLLLNVLSLLFSFPMPIALALIVNNIRNQRMKKFTQTAIYVPHFISTVVLAGILSRLISLTVDEATEKDLLFAEIHKFANESLSNFIVKGVTDESWENYQNTLKSLRLDDYISLYQTAYDRYLAANQ